MKQLPVQTQTVKDIRGKELLYVIIGDAESKVIMNVGQKTYDSVRALTEPAPAPSKGAASKTA